MYATCISCHAPLGKNEALEHFPVGRRLAYDAAKGRLWVVCAACKQWNLSPLEERWEAIEEAERIYRATKLRAATDNVGLARIREGTELIRIGEPLRPEFAAWRYGERFGARWRRDFLLGALAVTVGYGLGPLVGVAVGGAPYMVINWLRRLHDRRTLAGRIVRGDTPLIVRGEVAERTRIELRDDEPGGWRLAVPLPTTIWRYTGLDGEQAAQSPVVRVRGPEAVELARQILPHVNASGGRTRAVRDAVRVLEEAGTMERTFRLVTKGVRLSDDRLESEMLGKLPTEQRLALEMAVHEDTERRAMEGELQELEEEIGRAHV